MQLSPQFGRPSPSASLSQRSPTPSPLMSDCTPPERGFEMVGQLSSLVLTPSPSGSSSQPADGVVPARRRQPSTTSKKPSLSSSSSQASPKPSLSVLICAGSGKRSQRSSA